MWPWRVKMPTQNLLKLLLLQMLMLRIMLATVCWFASWRLVIKLKFCSDFEHKGWSRFWSWSLFSILPLMCCRGWILVKILKLGLDKILNFKFSRDADVWLRFWSWCSVEILKMKFDKDLCKIWTQPSGPLCFWQCFLRISLSLMARLVLCNGTGIVQPVVHHLLHDHVGLHGHHALLPKVYHLRWWCWIKASLRSFSASHILSLTKGGWLLSWQGHTVLILTLIVSWSLWTCFGFGGLGTTPSG